MEEKHEDSCGKQEIGETPQGISPRRLTTPPRKAKCFSGTVVSPPPQITSHYIFLCIKNNLFARGWLGEHIGRVVYSPPSKV
ncbi:hypothetical protein FH966_07900 [Lentibacillus cibarius]|uniref:Uncharacterized protein n=1 Tax=Lentibacillus cibarius TaxID=2583219 RepID=A0A549YIB4_9BACI|nr:hypothetical protein FH966_07900 [Lentibacillus cibarius]